MYTDECRERIFFVSKNFMSLLKFAVVEKFYFLNEVKCDIIFHDIAFYVLSSRLAWNFSIQIVNARQI